MARNVAPWTWRDLWPAAGCIWDRPTRGWPEAGKVMTFGTRHFDDLTWRGRSVEYRYGARDQRCWRWMTELKEVEVGGGMGYSRL